MIEPKLAGHIRVVQPYPERLALLQRAWDNLALLSQMNSNGMDSRD
jgi:hypothetical protein